MDKRYLDPRRSLNPSQAEKEEGVIPLTDSLPIIPQVLVIIFSDYTNIAHSGVTGEKCMCRTPSNQIIFSRTLS